VRFVTLKLVVRHHEIDGRSLNLRSTG
jgi:hypothetical protein